MSTIPFLLLKGFWFSVAMSASVAASGQTDSGVTVPSQTTVVNNITYKLSLTSSYSTYSNWSSGNHNNFSFQGNGDFYYTARKEKFRQQYTIRSSLHYVKYVDSL